MMRLLHHRRLMAALCLATIVCCLMIAGPLKNTVVVRKIYYLIYPEESIGCYRLDAESLPDISDIQPRKGKSIFFHETSCSSFLAGKVWFHLKTNRLLLRTFKHYKQKQRSVNIAITF